MPEQEKENREAMSVGIRLVPVENSDQPVLANCTDVTLAPGHVYIDFGFIEPRAIPALARAVRGGAELPKAINGKLVARLALSADVALTLRRQLASAVDTRRRPVDEKSRAAHTEDRTSDAAITNSKG